MSPVDGMLAVVTGTSLLGRVVFVNGTESFVKVSITFRDNNGKIISSIRNLQIDYRIGYLTTVRGNFLTASTGGGIQIDTEWSGEYEIEF